MPENVTRFQPSENVKKSLIRWTHIDIMPSRLPTFFHEEPIFSISPISLRRLLIAIKLEISTIEALIEGINFCKCCNANYGSVLNEHAQSPKARR